MSHLLLILVCLSQSTDDESLRKSQKISWNKEKDGIVSSISHEWRAKINMVKNSVERVIELNKHFRNNV